MEVVMADPQHSQGPLRSEFAGDPEMKELIELFLQELPVRIESIRAAMETGDATALKRLAHQLRGASAGYGYPTLGTAAGAVEDRIKALGAEAAPQTLTKIGAEVGALVDMCRRACAA
jgi:HPt (histidine-containing phosphotransfer) domain-containing protein